MIYHDTNTSKRMIEQEKCVQTKLSVFCAHQRLKRMNTAYASIYSFHLFEGGHCSWLPGFRFSRNNLGITRPRIPGFSTLRTTCNNFYVHASLPVASAYSGNIFRWLHCYTMHSETWPCILKHRRIFDAAWLIVATISDHMVRAFTMPMLWWLYR